MSTVRWNIAVSPEVDQSVRMFLAAQGGGRKGDLSRFIEESVRAYLLERAADQAKTAAGAMAEAELAELIDEAVQWAREDAAR
ncbi:MAG: ribbon-helix-helix domain-containing protein [Proteobacteria bacterium]|nr:ribbon-helix-helix domain-containing protein [Pseudomonadota bacterium]MBS0494097.1 ribbon-helix-helix domain-containing protein [Pseudomonadota bacterium]